MGKHHARTWKKIAGARLVAVVDADMDRAETVADEFGVAAVSSTDELLAKFPAVSAVSVAVPTIFHVKAATPLLERGIACLVEKPLAATVADARFLAELAQKNQAILQVGHTERFNPAVRALTSMSIRPRFMSVDRVSPMTFRSLDVGVVMDMMIHDLDIVLALADSPLERVDATGVAVLGKHEDVANTRLVFQNGCVANLTASRLALKTERKLRIFSETAYVSLDYQKRTGVVIRSTDNNEALATVRAQLEAGADLSQLDYSKLVKVVELSMDETPGNEALNDPLTAELTSFLDAARNKTTPVVDGWAGVAAVEAAQRVVDSIQSHRWDGLPTNKV